jgi:hypothetical protein
MSAEATDLSEIQCANVRRTIDRCLGLTPSDIPADAKWIRTDDNIAEGTEVYQLTYAKRDRFGMTLLHRWTINIDPLTRLPREVQAFQRPLARNEWLYAWRMECRYLAEDEMAATIGLRR